MERRIVGTAAPRKEAVAKVNGTAQYVDDLSLPGMLHGITIRSSEPRALIRDVRFGDGIPWNEFTVVRASDIPGRNVVTLIFDDQPFLADSQVNHAQEPVLLLAHENKDLVHLARNHVLLEYEPLTPIFDM